MNLDADTPTPVLLALRRAEATRAAADAEIHRRMTVLGPGCDSPVALGKALGCVDRTVRRLLDQYDREGRPVRVGWIRTQGGGQVKRRARIRRGAEKEGVSENRQGK